MDWTILEDDEINDEELTEYHPPHLRKTNDQKDVLGSGGGGGQSSYESQRN